MPNQRNRLVYVLPYYRILSIKSPGGLFFPGLFERGEGEHSREGIKNIFGGLIREGGAYLG